MLFSKNSLSLKSLLALLILSTLILWSPAIFTPFWGDDYYFLMQAREVRLNHVSWLMPFMSESSTGFWRPLSMDTPWRIIEQLLEGDPIYAHLFSFSIWLLSICSFAYLALCISRALSWKDSYQLVLLSVLVYSSSAIHLLVLHWVSAINSSFLVTFSCLTLALWIKTFAEKQKSNLNTILILCSLLAALFSKESAILLPLLMICVTVFMHHHNKLSHHAICILLSVFLICCVWFYFFRQFTHSRHASYELIFGMNVVENGLALFAWIANVPREAIRLVVDGDVADGIIWTAACAIPASIFFGIALFNSKRMFDKTQYFSIILFLCLAYGPYFFLSNQSYEYYAAVAFILPAIFLAKCLVHARFVYVAVFMFLISSFVSIQGTRLIGYPGLIGRANWGEEQLQALERQPVHSPLIVEVTNPHQFYAIGVKGLSWRLKISESEIQIIDDCTQSIQGAQRVLRLGSEGNYIWQRCSD